MEPPKITAINTFDDAPQKALEDVLQLVKDGEVKDVIILFDTKSSTDNDMQVGYRTTANMFKTNWLLDIVKADFLYGPGEQ